MHLIFNLILFILTFAGGSLPLWIKGLDDKKMLYILSFSGSFLLGITFLHLLPETFAEIGEKAGLLMLVGFFVQLIIQRVTHGLEHGHVHIHPHEHHVPLYSILVGLAIHAFMEGLPLGFNYRLSSTEPSLYLAVAAHKLPEAMLVTTLVASVKSKRMAVITLLIFSLLTPIASSMALFLGVQYRFIAQLVIALIPIVAGAFIHISTTIFFESGTKQHLLTWQKIVAILLGVSLALATLAIE